MEFVYFNLYLFHNILMVGVYDSQSISLYSNLMYIYIIPWKALVLRKVQLNIISDDGAVI